MTHWPSSETGIVASDDDRLILKAFPLNLSRRSLIGLVAALVGFIGTAAALAAWLFAAHLSIASAVLAATVAAAVWSYRVTTEVTLIILRQSTGIFIETRNPLLGLRTCRPLHLFGEITAVEVRSRLNPNSLYPGASPTGAYVHYDVSLRKANGRSLLWYTRYSDAAGHIARTIAAFAGAPVLNLDVPRDSHAESRAT